MKASSAICCFLFLFPVAFAKNDDIEKIVGKLKDMLEESKDEGKEDDKMWKEFKAYCDKNTEQKTENVAKLKDKIELLKGEIALLLASNGELSITCGKLKTTIHSLREGIEEAKSFREKEHDDFVDVREDNEQAIKNCEKAIKVLAEVGADQTDGSNAEHEQFMAGFEELVQIKNTVRTALAFASSFLTKKHRRVVESFIQAPFTGTYTAQSGEVVGILKNMLDTFKSNLMIARGGEEKAVTAHEGLLKFKEASLKELEAAFEDKQKEMGSNDEELATKKEQLAEAESNLEDDQEFLSKLIPMCKEKARQYKSRKMLRKAEQEAIKQAIRILTSDSADAGLDFQQIGSARHGGAATLLQIGSVRRAALDARRQGAVLALLRRAARRRNSLRLAQVAMAIESGNPFTVIFEKIEEIIGALAKEGKADKKEKKFCEEERAEKKDDLKKLKKSLRNTKEEITDLHELIEDERTGLVAQIKDTEERLHEVHEEMEDQTKKRAEENKEYQKVIKHAAAGQHVVKNAIKILKLHYEKEAEKASESFEQEGDEPALLQLRREDPPKTWDDGEYEGQSKEGNKVIGMLEDVLKDMVDAEMEDHGDEQQSQESYEDEMKELSDEEHEHEESLADLNLELSDKERELIAKKKEKEATIETRDGVEAYLEHIKPSCDFIDENFEKREKGRADEKEALEKAIDLLKSSPGYTIAKAKAEEDSWGECKPTCKEEGKDHAKCQACLGGISVPGYCTTHGSAPGC